MIEVNGSIEDSSLLNELIRDIQHRGLMFRILVQPLAHGRYYCINGRLRVLAYRRLNRSMIPCEVI